MWTPGGSQTRSKRAEVFGLGERYALDAEGQHVWLDNESQPYVDWIAGLASVGLGYGRPEPRPGNLHTTYPLPVPEEAEVAKELLSTLPQVGWDQVRWVTTGSEATLAAMMIARKATGRRKIISIGYHGWHSAHLPSEEMVCLPIEAANTWACHRILMDGTVAAVLVEPMRNEIVRDDGERLHVLIKEAHQFGTLVIMDEIVTGFRYALGGATEMFGLKPDLACYGKAMSNGYPIAAVVGPRRLMQHALDISSTYGGWPPALVAVRETLQVYITEPVIKTLWERGQRLLDQTKGVLTGYPVHPVFAEGVNALELTKKAAAAGHLIHPAGFNIMYAHTDADVDSLARALQTSA